MGGGGKRTGQDRVGSNGRGWGVGGAGYRGMQGGVVWEGAG